MYQVSFVYTSAIGLEVFLFHDFMHVHRSRYHAQMHFFKCTPTPLKFARCQMLSVFSPLQKGCIPFVSSLKSLCSRPPLYAGASSTFFFVQDVCRRFQPCTSVQTAPWLTLNLTRTQPYGGLEVGGGVHAAPPRVLVAFFRKNARRPNIGPTSCTTLYAGLSCT